MNHYKIRLVDSAVTLNLSPLTELWLFLLFPLTPALRFWTLTQLLSNACTIFLSPMLLASNVLTFKTCDPIVCPVTGASQAFQTRLSWPWAHLPRLLILPSRRRTVIDHWHFLWAKICAITLQRRYFMFEETEAWRQYLWMTVACWMNTSITQKHLWVL